MNLTNQLVFRVVTENREQYRVSDENNHIWAARITGKLRDHSTTLPIVGDWVRGTPQPGDWVQIDSILERKTVLARKDTGRGQQILATNIDTLFIVTSANQDLNPNRLDRYLLLATTGGILPVILINKIELSEDPQGLLNDLAARFLNVDIHGVSVYEGWNLESLEKYAYAGQTVAFVGSSGVGKSSLVNALLGQSAMAVNSIRESDSRGRHTTTQRELHMTSTGVAVIDTPGIRQVGLTEDTHLGTVFEDVEDLMGHCRFTDCGHNSEPGCAIRQALENGGLANERWGQYLKLQKEMMHEQRKISKALQSERKKKWAKVHQAQRERQKLKNKVRS